MALSPGTRLGPYEIHSALGAGGMGEVYKARDTRLERTVAIKVLPATSVLNPEMRQRFEREARVIATLTHPHICTLYDVGRERPRPAPGARLEAPASEESPVDFLVMEYLEGETLADRLGRGIRRAAPSSGSGRFSAAVGSRGRLTIEEALRYGIEIADALDKAHGAGIVHRDLKPGNIMLTRSGTKLLDFGLAKVVAPQSSLGLTAYPTERAITTEGAILGTFQYMAPEQLEGNEADPRTDIFAFGATMYEMVAGRKAFEGKSQAGLIAAILATDPPPLSAEQPLAPRALERALQRCLAKDPEDRWQTARDLKAELVWIAERGDDVGQSAPRRPSNVARLTWMTTGVAAGLAATLTALALAGRLQAPSPDRAVVRFHVAPPDGAWFETLPIDPQPAISPDGRQLAFVASTAETSRVLWVRDLDGVVPRPLDGTSGVFSPFWSPDGRFIGIFAHGKLVKIRVAGGSPEPLCDAGDSFGGTWNRDGTILFAARSGNGLYKIAEDGGDPEIVRTLDASREETSYRFPHFLPDGRHYLYLVRSGRDAERGVYVGSLGSADRKRLLNVETSVVYAPPGYLVYVRGTTLMAQPFDASRLDVTGDPMPVTERMTVAPTNRGVAVSVSGAALAYRTDAGPQLSEIVWLGRDGKELGTIGSAGVYQSISLSPDERRVALEVLSRSGDTSDVWLLDVSTGAGSRFTFDASRDGRPVWSPDGTRVVFASTRSGFWNMYVKSLTGGEEQLLAAPELHYPRDMSTDVILYERGDPATGVDLWLLPISGDRKPRPLIQTNFNETEARLSPDGRFVVYVSDESGSRQVYVQPIPLTGSKWQISGGGGSEPRWRRDGKELFYLGADDTMMAVTVKPAPAFEARVPAPLFRARVTDAEYAVSADGQRFLMLRPIRAQAASPLTMVLNWTAGLDRKP